MRFLVAAFILAGSVVASSAAYADNEDRIWIAQCIRDKAASSVPTKNLMRYCACMTNKMDDNEERSVAEWEPTHPDEVTKCEHKAQISHEPAAAAPSVPQQPAPPPPVAPKN